MQYHGTEICISEYIPAGSIIELEDEIFCHPDDLLKLQERIDTQNKESSTEDFNLVDWLSN